MRSRLQNASMATISAGARVRIAGLKAQPRFNGKVGTAVEWVAARGRWLVRVDGDLQLHCLKPGDHACSELLLCLG